MKDVLKIINLFYGGMVRDDKSKIIGASSNMEELDPFANQDYIQAEQIVSSDSLPADTETWAYTAGDDDVVYGYGKKTSTSVLRILSVASGSATNPTTFSTLYTSADTTNLPTKVSDFKFFRSQESSNPTKLIYVKGASSTWNLYNYNISTATETSYGQLTGLSGSFDRPTTKVIYGEVYALHGRFIAKIDKDNVFTEKAFTLPQEWEAVDIIAVSAGAIILCRNKNRAHNVSKGFWWDLTATSQFEDSFTIPFGGPQWVSNHKETIKILCAINGTARIFQLSYASPGSIPLEIPGIAIQNVGTETSTQPISSPKMLGEKDKILYFGLFKTDKTGLYAIGQLDSDKPNCFLLSKRFNTTNYASHSPTGVLIQGPNYYLAYDDNGTASNARCHSLNSPTRSSTAVYESIWVDNGQPYNNKNLEKAYLTSYPLGASTSLDLYIATDYSSSYTQVKRPSDTIFNTSSGILGFFKPAAFKNKKAFKAKVLFTSNTSTSPKLQSIGLRMSVKDDDLAES